MKITASTEVITIVPSEVELRLNGVSQIPSIEVMLLAAFEIVDSHDLVIAINF